MVGWHWSSRSGMPFPAWKPPKRWRSIRATFLQFIQASSAICALEAGRVVGALLFSKENGILCFLAVDPAYRRQHIARQMVDFMLTQMERGKAITVTTYREGDPNGVAARAFYKRLGFCEGRLTEEFGCPVQEFILNH